LQNPIKRETTQSPNPPPKEKKKPKSKSKISFLSHTHIPFNILFTLSTPKMDSQTQIKAFNSFSMVLLFKKIIFIYFFDFFPHHPPPPPTLSNQTSFD